MVNVAIPNLIASDLVMVSPMSSMTGYVSYVEYTTSTKKGDTDKEFLNSPFKMNDGTVNYTSDKVVETFATGQEAISWTPVATGTQTVADGVTADLKVTRGSTVYYVRLADATTGKVAGAKSVDASGTETAFTFAANDKIAYVYDNIVVPQDKIPTIKAEMKAISLLAKARRVAVHYSQIAAYQAKTDYGMNLGDSLTEQACGQLSYKLFVA